MTRRQRDAEGFIAEATRPETRGIELIGADDRRGRPGELFWVWAAPNVSVLNFTFGATLILLGLGLGQAIAVTVAANLLWGLTGYIATCGPATGTASSVVTRSMYGVLGNKVVIALTGWLLSAVFLAINWIASSFMGADLLARLGWDSPTAAPILVTLVVSALTTAVAVYGHGFIVRTFPAVTIGLLVVFLAALVAMAPSIDWGYAVAEPLEGVALWSSLTIGFTILAATPLSYLNSPDLARYLPATAPASRIVLATALGGALPCILFTIAGALLATGIADAVATAGMESALLDLLPGWLAPLFVAAVVLNTVSLNGMTTYSASMAMQAIGFPIRRIPAALVIGVLGTALTIYLLLSATMLDAINMLLQVVVVVVGPAMAIFVTDLALGRPYAATDLVPQDRTSTFWYTGGWSLAGIVALLLGGASAALCLTTETWSGPIATRLDYIDLSVPVGIVIAGMTYAVLRVAGSRRSTSLTKQLDEVAA